MGTLVIGAGPGGLGAAGALRQRGLSAVVIERGPGPGAKWRANYDRLEINTSAWFSYLPGMRFPASVGQWPSRLELVRYYERYAERYEIPVRSGVEANRVHRADGCWRIETSRGEIQADTVIVATSKDRTPVIPDWEGRETYSGKLIHSADYRNAQGWAGADALVVGAGNSGMDIALDLLAGGARVQMAIRRAPHIVRRSTLGMPNDLFAVLTSRLPARAVDRMTRWLRRVSIGDLAEYGLPIPTDGLATRMRSEGAIPTSDQGEFISPVESRELEIVAGLASFEGPEVVLRDGSRTKAELVVAATGYRPGLEPLVGHLGLLDDRGRPLVNGPSALRSAANLYFIGFTDVLSGNLRQLRLDAIAIADRISRTRPDASSSPPLPSSGSRGTL